MEPIMLATDGTPSAEAATAQALQLAHALGAPLLVACAAHDAIPLHGYPGYRKVVADQRRAQEENRAKAFAAVRRQTAALGLACETLPLEGVPGEAICRAAHEHDVQMIVIGAHNWGPVGRLLHESVSTYILHHADRPVLLVRGDKPEATNNHTHTASATRAC